MSYLDDLIARANRKVSNFEIPRPNAKDCVEHDRFDHAFWAKTRTTVPAIGAAIDQLSMDHAQVEDGFEDAFNLAFKATPRIRDDFEVADSHLGNWMVAQDLNSMPEFEAVRQFSKGDVYGSAAALVAMQDAITAAYERAEAARELAQAAIEAAKDAAEQMAQELKDAADSLAMQPATDPNGLPSKGESDLQAKMDQFDQANQDVKDAQAEQQKAMDQSLASTRSDLRDSAQKAADQLAEEDEMMSSFGVDDGDLQRMSVEERMQLATKIRSNRLYEFMKILGQFRMVQQAESRRKVMHADSEVADLTFGNDLSRVVASEYLNFADPSLETLMLARYAEHQLLQYDVRGKERQGKGPIICVVDESGSMGCVDCGGASREAWSKALSLAMCDQARQQGRDFTYIGFASARQQHRVDFPKGVGGIDKTITMTEHFFNGGTSYEEPLMMALKIVEEEYEVRDLPKPDIVLISDDEYRVTNVEFMAEWNRVKDKTSLRCYGVAIGCSSGTAMDAICDDVRQITEIASDPRVMADVFRTI